MLASPGQRPAGEGSEDEGYDEPSSDGHRSGGILFLLIAGGGEPESDTGAEERDVDEQGDDGWQAPSEGRSAAAAIDEYLEGTSELPRPVKTTDRPISI